MAIKPDDTQSFDPATFDPKSGSLMERILFGNRVPILILCGLITLFLGFQAFGIRMNASFERMIPLDHPYIVNFLKHRGDIGEQGNTLKVVVENRNGSIIDYDYLKTLQKINDELFLIPGVERNAMRSLWTPPTRWFAMTPYGIDGGPVMPNHLENTQKALDQIRLNIERADIVGTLVANDFKSSAIVVPLLDKDPRTGKALDYGKLSKRLDTLKKKYESKDIAIHITGFAKIVGDIIEALYQLLFFFAVSIFIATLMVYGYTRCLRSTALVVICSLVAVIWQMGILAWLGYQLDPYSILVPFLVFAIGMSHGAQKMNGVMQDIGRGAHKLIAARLTFRRLFLAGFTALVCDAVGFGVLMLINIDAIRDLAFIASAGVAILIFTNLILLPILLSFTNVNARSAQRSLKAEIANLRGEKRATFWRFLLLFTSSGGATFAVVAAAVLGIGGWYVSQDLKIGDLDAGAPELRADSTYNRDNAYLTSHYMISSDLLVVMVETPRGTCTQYDTLKRIDNLQWELEKLPGVESTKSFVDLVRQLTSSLTEGSLKWYALIKNQATLNMIPSQVLPENMNAACSLLTIQVALTDHKAETLQRVVKTVESFAKRNDDKNAKFLLAAGNAGIEAATNIVLEKASRETLYLVYAAVTILCFITFRSWRAVVCAILPLALTSILAEALMVKLGIGVKVATLPVIALGVGIGVDYALYVLSIMLAHLRKGESLTESYYQALLFTGRVVLLTGFTLAIGVAMWIFSPIKFQADMGLLLAFMFLWNMMGALMLMPALAYFLLPRSFGAETSSPEAAIGEPA